MSEKMHGLHQLDQYTFLDNRDVLEAIVLIEESLKCDLKKKIHSESENEDIKKESNLVVMEL